MSCQELHDLLVDYFGGELLVEQRRTVEIHLSECKHCVTLVHTYSCTIRLARALPRCDRLPAAVENRLREFLMPYMNKDGD